MEPNQSANPTPTNEANNDQAKNTAQPSQSAGADNQGAASKGSSAGQQSADGKSWTEYANLQKVVDQLPQGVRDFCSNSWNQVGKSLGQVGDQVNKLSTTQKVAGAVALAGIGYLALRSGKSEKSSGIGSMYRGDSSKGSKKSQQGYRSSADSYTSASYNSFSSPSSRPDESKRMDRGPGHYGSSSFDRQNESRVGGSYQSGSSSQSPSSSSSGSSAKSSDYSSGANSASSSQSSSMSGRSMGYRGSSNTSPDSDELDLGAGV
ncbi:hypothetical protein [Hymenobacter fodinae]|uniref:Uncharacterized protein n=1 Tax=Hymenobacter fodinae TaxID=2510796 RepID=A0A4Z0P3L6_9BACT|nr:hypothetical protein [Hymenobacter fodinae]TGE06244.1 hypothetical protein EU556_15425 [Hymenobacter fodinae]